MHRSIFQFVVLPYLTRTATCIGTQATFPAGSRRWKSTLSFQGELLSALPLSLADTQGCTRSTDRWSTKLPTHSPTTGLSVPQTNSRRRVSASWGKPKEPLKSSISRRPRTASISITDQTHPDPSSSSPTSNQRFTTSVPHEEQAIITKSRLPVELPSTYPGTRPKPRLGDPPHVHIAALAFRKIIEAHTPRPDPTRRKISLLEFGGPLVPGNPRFVHPQIHPDAVPPLPPAIHRLLIHKLFRMAVFHFIDTPEYASNTALMERLAEKLELNGAGKLAYALRRGWSMPRLAWPHGTVSSAGKARLEMDPEPDASRKPNKYWIIPTLPTKPLPDQPGSSPRVQTQQHLNAQLTYLLSRPTHPYSPSPPGSTLPSPDPSLSQLGRLLVIIDRMQKEHNFVPNRITANIIIRCWLRCGVESLNTPLPGIPDHHLSGNQWKRKEPTRTAFGSPELRSIFKVTSELMLQSADLKGDPLQYRRHVRPFCKMMKRAARALGDREVFTRAVKMQQELKTVGRQGEWDLDRDLGKGEGERLGEDGVRAREESGWDDQVDDDEEYENDEEEVEVRKARA